MTASSTDKLKKLARKWVGQIGAAGVSDASTATIPLSSTTNLPTDTAVVATIDRVDANGTKTASLEETVIGVVSGSNLVTCTRGAEGTAQAHSAGAVVEILVTAKGYNDIIDHLLIEHNQDGTHLSSVVTTLTGTQTLTNKTLTSPKIGTNIKDTNGNELITLTATGSAVNEVTLANGATGTGPTFTASGDDTNINLNLKGKGTGEAKIYNYDDSTYYSAGEFLNNSLYRQAIINGNFDVWQRGTSFTNPAATSYTADRWHAYKGAYATGMSVSQQTVVASELAGSKYCARIQRTAGDATSDGIYMIYTLETVDSLKFIGNKLTLSFYARKGANYSSTSNYLVTEIATGTGTDQKFESFTGYAADSQNNTLTASWAKFTMTTSAVIATSKTEIGIRFGFTGTGTAGAADYFEIAQVQLCAGDVALPFMPKSFDDELRVCKRYYQRYGYGVSGVGIAMGHGITTGRIDVALMLQTEMRIAPTCTYNAITANDASAAETFSALNAGSIYSTNSVALQFDCNSTSTVDRVYKIVTTSTTSYLDFSSEL